MNVRACHFHPEVYRGEETVNIANVLRDDGLWSAISPLTDCHKANNNSERTLQMVDSTLPHHQYNICSMLIDFNVYTPPVVRELSIKGFENALLLHILWYSYLLPSIPRALTLRHVALLPSPCIFTGTIKGRNVFHAEYKSAFRVFHSHFCACQHFSSFFSPLLSCHAFFSHSLCINHYSLYTGGLRKLQVDHSRWAQPVSPKHFVCKCLDILVN